MDSKLQELMDRIEIIQLGARMSHLLNDQKIDELLDCYVPDGVFQVDDNAPITDRSALIALMRSMPGVIHMTLDVVVDVRGDIALADSHLIATWARRHQAGNGFLYSGRYHDKLRRTSLGWKMAERRLRLDLSGDKVGEIVMAQVGPIDGASWREERGLPD